MNSTRDPQRRRRRAGHVQASLTALACALPLLLLVGCGTKQSNDGADRASACAGVATQPGYRPVAPDGVPPDAVSAAERDLPQFLRGETSSRLCGLGALDAGATALGAPYRRFTTCLSSDPGSTAGTVTPADIWEFPVVVDGAYRCMLTVARMNDRWQGVGLGDKQLAESLQTIETTHPSLSFSERGIVSAPGSCCAPAEFLGIQLTGAGPSFLPVPPWAESVATLLPRYAGWTSADPVPVISWEELSRFARARP